MCTLAHVHVTLNDINLKRIKKHKHLLCVLKIIHELVVYDKIKLSVKAGYRLEILILQSSESGGWVHFHTKCSKIIAIIFTRII